MAEKRIIVLSDGTWETVGGADGGPEVWEITDEAYDKLLNGDAPKHLATADIITTKEIA